MRSDRVVTTRRQRFGGSPFRAKVAPMRLFLLLFLLSSAPVRACEVALVVALDVSRSVDKYEYWLMRDGIAAAFLDEDVAGLIEDLPGGIMVMCSCGTP